MPSKTNRYMNLNFSANNTLSARKSSPATTNSSTSKRSPATTNSSTSKRSPATTNSSTSKRSPATRSSTKKNSTKKNSTKQAADLLIANTMEYLSNKDINNLQATDKRINREIKVIKKLTRGKEKIAKPNLLKALNKYIKMPNNQRVKYIFNVKEIQSHLNKSQLNDNALTDDGTRFIVDGKMIKNTSDEILYRDSLIRMVIWFLPDKAYEFVTSFVNSEEKYVHKVDKKLLLYNYDGKSFENISSNLTSDLILFNASGVYSNVNKYLKETKNIILGPLVTSIGDSAFSDFTILESIIIPNSVTSIGNSAFVNCHTLISLVIPNSVMSIGISAFFECQSLTSLVIPNSVTSISYGTFANCINLTSVIIPDSITSIGDYAFTQCVSLTSIAIPNSVTSIRDEAFSGCLYLESIVIPNSVKRIGSEVFANCVRLKLVTISSLVIRFGSYIFNNCEMLQYVKLLGGTNKHWKDKLNTSMFQGCNKLIKDANIYGSKDVIDYIIDSQK
jgi:hypothetical protein